MNSTPVVEINKICKQFGGFRLDEVSTDLYRGEVHVIVGENGSGKSTLMKLISGWFKPESGQVLLDGEEVQFNSIPEARSGGIAYLNQDIQNFENLTVAENVYFPVLQKMHKYRYLVDKYKLISDCHALFSRLNIQIDPAEKLETCGFAERQLIAAVQGYICDAEVIIFDEPSSAMNDPERDILFRIVAELKALNKAIFYISHRMDEIREIGDRVSVMHQGKIMETRSCSDLSIDSLVSMMTGDVHKDRYPRIETKEGEIILEVQNLQVKPILKDVTFELKKGEILGITGLMGSGRTLLANCLFGATRPNSGEIIMGEESVKFSSPVDAMRRGISLIPEDRIDNGLFSKQDLVSNSTTAALHRFLQTWVLNDYDMQILTQDYVREMSINPGKNEDSVIKYSGGNQQKVLITRWLMNRSKIYIMDEPTRSIDAASKIDIYNAMNDLTRKGVSIILISSEIEEILGMCDRILVLARGVIASEMSRKEATKSLILKYAT